MSGKPEDAVPNSGAAGPACSSCRAPGAPHACSRCKTARYCNAECQREHWSTHKQPCRTTTGLLAFAEHQRADDEVGRREAKANLRYMFGLMQAKPGGAQATFTKMPVAMRATNLVGAVIAGDADLVDKFLKWGADPAFLPKDEGKSALHVAAILGDAVLMRKLLAQVKRKADLDTLAIQGGSTALARAAYGFGDPDGHVECVRMLLKAGADPNVKSVEEPRDTALHGACKNGAAIGVIAALVNAGADVHSRDDAGSTPLQNVVFDHPHSEATIRLLVLAGADMECRNKSGHRILDYCADHGSELNARTLIELGADTSPVVVTEISKLLHMLGHTETTYLHMAASKNAVGILRDAHRAGVDLFHKLPGGTHRTPLHAAVMCNSVEAAAFILESVPPAKAKRLVDEPALINCFRSRAALAPTLLQQFIHDPEQAKAAVASYVAQIESSEYDTSHQPLVQSPLAVAVDSGYPAMVRLLLKHGANPDQLEGTGKPVLAHALVSANMGKGQASWEFAKDWHEFGRTDEEQSVLVHPKLRADKKAKGNEPFNTLFEQSPAAKFFKIARKLIRSGATLTGFDGYGYTMMHNACNCGDLKVTRMIIERTGGAEVNTVTSKDCEYEEYAHRRSTPLHLVVRIDAMADLLNTNDDVVGMAARDEAGIIDLLLSNGAAATIDAKDHDGETPLIAALKNEYPRYDSIMALLKGGADVTIPDSDGETPLQLFKSWWKARGRRIAESGAWIGQHGQEGHFKGKALALIPSAAWDSERAGEVLSALKAK